MQPKSGVCMSLACGTISVYIYVINLSMFYKRNKCGVRYLDRTSNRLDPLHLYIYYNGSISQANIVCHTGNLVTTTGNHSVLMTTSMDSSRWLPNQLSVYPIVQCKPTHYASIVSVGERPSNQGQWCSNILRLSPSPDSSCVFVCVCLRADEELRLPNFTLRRLTHVNVAT